MFKKKFFLPHIFFQFLTLLATPLHTPAEKSFLKERMYLF